MSLMRFSSPSVSVAPLRSCRIRFGDFFVRMWFLNAFFRRTFPDAVRRNRFAALRFVFIFGMGPPEQFSEPVVLQDLLAARVRLGGVVVPHSAHAAAAGAADPPLFHGPLQQQLVRAVRTIFLQDGSVLFPHHVLSPRFGLPPYLFLFPHHDRDLAWTDGSI